MPRHRQPATRGGAAPDDQAGRNIELAFDIAGPPDAPAMLFVHPNAFERSQWLYQLAHFSRDYRCIAVDLPGYGTSPELEGEADLSAIADQVWSVLDRAAGPQVSPVLVGCSIGSHVIEHMAHVRPGRVVALVLSGTGWDPERRFAVERIAQYRAHGIAFIAEHARSLFSPGFRDSALADWIVHLSCRRNAKADVRSIIAMFEARLQPEPDSFITQLELPALVLSGSLDPSHGTVPGLMERLPRPSLAVLEGAGHACFVEQPGRFNAEVDSFLGRLRE